MILLLATPRSGSTWVAQSLSMIHNVENLNEFFSFKDIPESTALIEKLDYLDRNPNTLVKCFPAHIKEMQYDARVPFFERALFKRASKIYVLIRADYTAQCKSLYLASVSQVWNGTPQPHQVIKTDQSEFDLNAQRLQRAYEKLLKYYKDLDAELIVFEDMKYEDRKYIRPVTWDPEPQIPDFDVRGLFT